MTVSKIDKSAEANAYKTDGLRTTEPKIAEPKIAEPCVFVIFGATGDLTSRKLFPALYNLAKENQLPSSFACVGFARREKTDEQFRNEMKEGVNKYSRTKPVDEEIWQKFSPKVFYHRAEFHDEEGYRTLKKQLEELDQKLGTKGNRIYYLSVPPSHFETIVEHLSKADLLATSDNPSQGWTRVVVEKPFGSDLQSAIQLQKVLTRYLSEDQIYRIDHYLGKETVQNLLVFRFGNSIFESIWNNHHIDHVEITVSEDMGVGTRGKFFEEAGMLRDIVANHMMQLLAHVAMEPPASLKPDAIRNEKVKVLQCVRSLKTDELKTRVVRGQYGPGTMQGNALPGYREEANVDPHSEIETYVALEMYIDNWRWDGVPFYLRAGKRLSRRMSEIAITFKAVPGYLRSAFGNQGELESNVLVIRIQPDEGISLKINCKVPGIGAPIQPVKMDFKYGSYFGMSPPEAYERLLCDCMAGDSTLFAHINEVIASWKYFTPILELWKQTPAANFPNYEAGSFGPKEADDLLARTGRSWRIHA